MHKSSIDPMDARYWTLPQSVAWIATGTEAAVRAAPSSLQQSTKAEPAVAALLSALEGGRLKASACKRSAAPVYARPLGRISAAFIYTTETAWGAREPLHALAWADLCVPVTGPHAFDIDPSAAWGKVLIPRAQVQGLFPAQGGARGEDGCGRAPSESAVRALLQAEIEKAGGFLPQSKCADIVRAEFPTFSRDRARNIAKELTGNTKKGPRAPRK